MSKQANVLHLPLRSRLLAAALERILGLKPLVEVYQRWLEKPGSLAQYAPAAGLLEHTLDALDARMDLVHPERLHKIPEKGPVIFCANHPFGGIEGILLARLLLKHRPDLKVLVNGILTRIPEFRDLFIGVDVLSSNSTAKNTAGMKAVCRHLGMGGALLMFPAGTVASLDLREGRVVERPWTPMLGRLIRRYQASCMPFWVVGRNSKLFHAMGLIHRRLRTVMLARELSNKQGSTTQIVAGDLLSPKELSRFHDDQTLTGFLRLNSEVLQNINQQEAVLPEPQEVLEPPGFNEENLLRDLAGLDDCLLVTKQEFRVYCVPHARLGSVMTAIAWSRERTFRASGEGTGLELDTDVFDPHYLQLFVWDGVANKVVGAYRIGRCDEIVKAHGVQGLYSRSLFRYDEGYIRRLGSALEIGRSFVNLEYQRNPRALDLLWQGIGAYVAKNPEYHTLFGCVSISREHSMLARAFLSDTMLKCFPARPEFLTDIHPVSPLKVKGKIWTSRTLESLSDIAIINKLLGSFDQGRRVPVLLRHYLALNGRFVSFTVNHGFNSSLDGLILVDLRDSPVKYLNRYLGVEGTERFLQRWKQNEAAA
ncbi:MAG: lysophospholipid acyltransferase family protein [Pseudomonadales bacterium]|nr:lysophospholipid acyltransferase family protein [Pseudomonadales bacterium]